MMFVLITVAVMLGKAKIIPAIICSIITFIISYLCEYVTFLILPLFHFNMELLNTSPFIRVLTGFIPLFISLGISISIFFIRKKIALEKGE